jgi:CheY-like chemotaxis protein
LKIQVHDTGHGIPPDKQKDIFREFERLNHGYGQAGLGLGLSIVERIARMLGLAIELRSEPGKGTVFSITVPPGKAMQQRMKSPKTPLTRRGLGAVLNVLVVDNEESILAGMTALLSGWGCQVLTAASAAEAIAAFESTDGKVDLILADYHLHRDDGVALVDRLRTRARRQIPAILITAEPSKQVQDLAIAHNIQYMRKPLRPAALRAAMNHAVMHHEAAE